LPGATPQGRLFGISGRPRASAIRRHLPAGQQPVRPPGDLSRPIIMVGPGTGIAPLRGFLQEGEATGARGANWLFFGEQHQASDFYYRDEIETWRHEGHLDRLSLAFSRDQANKAYVQHRMIEQGAARDSGPSCRHEAGRRQRLCYADGSRKTLSTRCILRSTNAMVCSHLQNDIFRSVWDQY
jgi:hypothetical protein